MLVICEVCDNNVIDELSARKGETVCKLCKKEAQKFKNKYKIKVCKECGFLGRGYMFREGTLTCKLCFNTQLRLKRRMCHVDKST